MFNTQMSANVNHYRQRNVFLGVSSGQLTQVLQNSEEI